MILVTWLAFPRPRTGHGAGASPGFAAHGGVCHDGYKGNCPTDRIPHGQPAGHGDPGTGPDHKEWHVAVDADGAITAAPGSASLDRRAGSRVETIQLLTPEGERLEHPDYPLELADDEVKGLYRDLVLVRRIDTEAISLQRQGELGIWASLLGQEAAQVGSGRALGPRDMAFPTYREHGVAWVRGLDPLKLLELFRGVSHGGWDPAEHHFHLYTIVIGAQTLHATGYAMGIQRDGQVGENGEAAIVYFGDGAISQGDVNEAFIWASVFNAPVVFFCQNNQWAISEPLERQSRIPLFQRASGFGFPGIQVDGNDVFACLAVTRKAMQAAREGQGPTLIEAFTYRMGAHTTTDDPTRYRLAAELEAWKLKDPVERVKAYLVRTGAADPAFFEAVDAEAVEVGRRIRQGCLAMPDPQPLAIFENVYSEPTDLLRAEREQYAAYLSSFETEEAAR
jgi:2-oxoisovalerate dehydrogenase E1 component alpha subunit